jgi:hypothetical protein
LSFPGQARVIFIQPFGNLSWLHTALSLAFAIFHFEPDRVDGAKRPRRLAKAGVEAMDQWLAMLRTALEKNYDRLDEVLASLEQPKTLKGDKG